MKTTSIKKNKAGRPSVMTADIETKLESIFKIGGTDEEATTYAGIGNRTYYDHLEANPVFRSKMMAAKHYADIVAKNVVVDAIIKDKDLTTAKWWLEKRQFKDTTNIAIGGENVTFNIIAGGYVPKQEGANATSVGNHNGQVTVQDADMAQTGKENDNSDN